MSDDRRLDHICEPDNWPESMDDRWSCPECGTEHVPFRVADSPLRMPAGMSRPNALGWRGGGTGYIGFRWVDDCEATP